jgi:hypothetical protein
MPTINLTVTGKIATNSSPTTKIVCMNSDYEVLLNLVDCEYFQTLSVKKLVVKYGHYYKEADITLTTSGGSLTYTAKLPPIEAARNVEIGVYGKTSATDTDPAFSSTSAVFECDKSALCGAIVRKDTFRLKQLEATVNKTYKASDEGYDGYSEVDVQVGTSITEERGPIAVSFASGADTQVITPSVSDRTMSKVTLTRPAYLTDSNIKKGVNIAGVIGNYEQRLTTLEADHNGTFTPPTGYDGFSEVTVNTDASNVDKTIPVGSKFTYSYTGKKPTVTIDTDGIVIYGDTSSTAILFEAKSVGSCLITFTHHADNDDTTVLRTVYYTVTVLKSDYLIPEGTLDITENDEDIDVTKYAAVTVDVQPTLKTKTVSATDEDKTYKASDEGVDGFSEFTVKAATTTASGTLKITSADIEKYLLDKEPIPVQQYAYIEFDVGDYSEDI